MNSDKDGSYVKVVRDMEALHLPKKEHRFHSRDREFNNRGYRGRHGQSWESGNGINSRTDNFPRRGREGTGWPEHQNRRSGEENREWGTKRNSVPWNNGASRGHHRQMPFSSSNGNGGSGRRHSAADGTEGEQQGPLASSPSFVAKNYGMDDNTTLNFWLRKTVPPDGDPPTVFPVGHPNNSPVQTVWSATDREKSYWASRNLTFEIATKCIVKSSDDGMFYYNTKHSNVCYSGYYNFSRGNESFVVKSMFPEDKLKYLDDVGEQYGPCFWIRFTEFYGSTIAQIIAEEIPPESQIGLENSSSKILALIVSGSNFQGSACIAAAKYLTSFGYLVYLCPVKTKEPPFPWSSPEDVAYEDIFMVDDLKLLKDMRFDIFVAGVDDHTTPMSTIHVYKDWIRFARKTILVDPPMTIVPYSMLVARIQEGMESNNGSREVIIINAIRPAPYCDGEVAKVYVANYPTSQILRPLCFAPYISIQPKEKD